MRPSHDHPEGFDVVRVTRSADLSAIRDAWSALRDRAERPTLNSDFDRYLSTVEALGERGRPDVTLLNDDDGPRAIVIARTSRGRDPYRIGYGRIHGPRMRRLDVVHGGLLTDGTREAGDALLETLRGRLATREYDRIMINHMATDDPLLDRLASDSKHSVVTPAERHWRLGFEPGPLEETMSRLSRKHRYNLRRQDRLLCERFGGDVGFERVTAPTEVATFLADAASLNGRSYLGSLGVGLSGDETQRCLLLDAARQGRLRCYRLRGGGEPIAYQAGIVIDNVFHLLATAFDHAHKAVSPGQTLLVRVLGDLAETDIRSVDFGFGDAPYKRVFATAFHDESCLFLYGSTFRPTLARGLHRSTLWVVHRASALDPSGRWRRRVRRVWRRRLINT